VLEEMLKAKWLVEKSRYHGSELEDPSIWRLLGKAQAVFFNNYKKSYWRKQLPSDGMKRRKRIWKNVVVSPLNCCKCLTCSAVKFENPGKSPLQSPEQRENNSLKQL
jgi:hypothetical protein